MRSGHSLVRVCSVEVFHFGFMGFRQLQAAGGVLHRQGGILKGSIHTSKKPLASLSVHGRPDVKPMIQGGMSREDQFLVSRQAAVGLLQERPRPSIRDLCELPVRFLQ